MIIVKNINETIESLKENKIPFIIKSTLLSTKVYSKTGDFISLDNGIIKRSELFLIKMVQNHCNSLINIPKVNRSSISYIGNSTIFCGIEDRDVYEIDLSAAYWNLARKHNLISDSIYKKGMSVSKVARLVALGSTAKVVTEIKFDGHNFKKYKPIRSKTEGVFFKVSRETDVIMKRLIAISGSKYLFYWVDAIFVKGKDTCDRICDYLREIEEMDFKIKKIDLIKKNSIKANVFLNGEEREFLFKRPKTLDLSKYEVLKID